MAKCRDYERRHDCPYLYEVTDPDERVQVGTSMKHLDQYCFYCFKTERVRKVGHLASWTGRTPKWCPLGRDE